MRVAHARRRVGARWASGARLVRLASLVAVVFAPAAAAASGGAGHPLHQDVHSGRGVPLTVAAVALLLAVGGRRSRRAALLGLGLLVAVFGVETAVHSVHHLSDPRAATSCALLSAALHVSGVGPAVLDAGAPAWTAERSPSIEGERQHSLQVLARHDGRAPPHHPSA